jgi:tetratricopeptide (TPR) repeat protein
MQGRIAALAFLVALFAFAGSAQAFSQKQSNICAGADADAAIAACSKLLEGKASKQYMAIWLQNRGASYARKEDLDKALADLNHAVEIDPTVPESYINRAYVLNAKGDSDRALADLAHAIQLNPKSPDAYGIRCGLYKGKAEYDRAIADCDREVELAPKSSVAYSDRCLLYLSKKDFEKAIADCNRFVELGPKDSEAYAVRCKVYTQKGDYDLAMADCNKAIELNPKQEGAYRHRGVIYLKTGKFELARTNLDKALELKPNYQEAKANLAELAQAEAAANGTPIDQASAEPAANVNAPSSAAPLVSTPSAVPLGRRVALVIGNAQYQNIGRLDNPANDANLIAQALKEDGFELVGDGAQLDLDKAGLERAVQEFGNRLQGADVALFYYAGHGVQVRGANYLVPVNANPTKETDVDFQMLDANLVLRQMESAGTRLNLVMLDACRNNPFAGRGLRATGGGLAQMQAPEGTLISFPGTVAQDGSDGNSPYTKALAEIIRTPGLGIFDTFNQVGLKVKQSTGGAQRPWLSSSPIEGAFYFKPGS